MELEVGEIRTAVAHDAAPLTVEEDSSPQLIVSQTFGGAYEALQLRLSDPKLRPNKRRDRSCVVRVRKPIERFAESTSQIATRRRLRPSQIIGYRFVHSGSPLDGLTLMLPNKIVLVQHFANLDNRKVRGRDKGIIRRRSRAKLTKSPIAGEVHTPVPEKHVESITATAPERKSVTRQQFRPAQQSLRTLSLASDRRRNRNSVRRAEFHQMARLARDVAIEAQTLTFKDRLPDRCQVFFLVAIECRRRLKPGRSYVGPQDLNKGRFSTQDCRHPECAHNESQDRQSSNGFHESRRRCGHLSPSPQLPRGPNSRVRLH